MPLTRTSANSRHGAVKATRSPWAMNKANTARRRMPVVSTFFRLRGPRARRIRAAGPGAGVSGDGGSRRINGAALQGKLNHTVE